MENTSNSAAPGNEPGIAALIVATGKTAKSDKMEPLEELGAITALQRIVMVFERAGIERIAVLWDSDLDKPRRIESGTGVVYLFGSGKKDMFHNIKLGLEYLRDKCSGAVITHVNVPLFSTDTVERLISAPESAVCIPVYGGRTGHPMLLRSGGFQKILSHTGEGGLAGAVKASGLPCSFVEVADEGILYNVQSGLSYDRLLESHSLREFHPEVTISILREKPFYDPQAQQLLRLTLETGSMSEACSRMGISYSKGRKTVSLIEQQLGHRVIESRQGGRTGGHSRVTEKGLELMDSYGRYCTEAREYLQELFEKHFGFLGEQP